MANININIKCVVINGAVHYEVYDLQGNFIASADTKREALEEVFDLQAA